MKEQKQDSSSSGVMATTVIAMPKPKPKAAQKCCETTQIRASTPMRNQSQALEPTFVLGLVLDTPFFPTIT
jgi:hypothetical protein